MINKKFVLLFLIFIVLISGYYVTIIEKLPVEGYKRSPLIGPGLPPTDLMALWYIPDAQLNIKTQAYYIKKTPIFDGVTPEKVYRRIYHIFPQNISCDDAAYTLYSDGKNNYTVASFYFKDKSTFSKEREGIYKYLQKSGNLKDITEEINVEPLANSQYSYEKINMTEFSGKEEYGFILVYQKPFVSGRNDLFLVYYGVLGKSHTGVKNLEKIISESYFMANAKDGKVTAL